MGLKPQASPAGAERHDPHDIDASCSRHFPVRSRDWPEAPDGVASFASSGFSAIVAEFTACWERGEPTQVEAFLERIDAPHPADVVELIYREFCLAESLGLDPHPSDFLRRFPERGESLERLFRLHGALSSTRLRDWAAPEVLPEVGDEIGPYSLLRELGRGAFARVFLAEQADLDDRLVVVKISTRLTPEPRLLARARHSHIAEVLWHGTAEDGALQLICMPFLGGATLAAVLAERRRLGRRPRRGRDILADLDRVSATEYPKANLSRPAREIVQGLSYPAALAWLVARLAEALDHAFSRGVAHGDIKPSNVLLTADGNPMLLDFNLAVGWRLPGGADLAADAGGTLAYMAPERLRAVAGAPGVATPRAADRHRADIFSLGVVLLEALTGRQPDLPQARARSRQEIADLLASSAEQGGQATQWLARSSVPAGLRSILARCLASDPADRYGRAAELAEDLDRWRNDRPLAYAAEAPRLPRLGRWVRRQRVAVAAFVLALVVGASVLLVGWSWFHASLRTSALDRLALIWDRDESGAFRFHLFGHWETEDPGDPIENAARQLDRYDVIADPHWRQRDDIRALPEPERSELQLWLLEQILRFTRALGEQRLDSPADWQRGLGLLDRELAEARFGSFENQRRILAQQLKLPDQEAPPRPPDTAPPPRWMEEYLLGVEAEPERARHALKHYARALADRPNSFWSHYRTAVVAYRLGDHQTAAEHLEICIGQRPDNPALRSQLATCLYELGWYDRALEQIDRALVIDPDHAMSMRTRTFLRSQLGQLQDLLADFRRYALLSRSPRAASALGIRLDPMLPSGLLAALGEDPLARVLEKEPPHQDDVEEMIVRASRLRDSGRCDEAVLVFDRAIDLAPEHLVARYFRGMLLRRLQRKEAELDFAFLIAHPRLEELLAKYPKAVGIYQQRCQDLFHAGRIAEAIPLAREGVVQANRYRSKRGEAHYTLARAYAVASKEQPGLLERVVDELRAAGEYSADWLGPWFESDPLFDEVRARVRPLLRGRP